MTKTPARAAIIYDFDGTLCPGVMHNHSFIPGLEQGTPEEFWAMVKRETKRQDADEVLIYMQTMISRSTSALTAQALAHHGSNLPLFDGVESWFSRVNAYALDQGLALEHYVVSSGIREMIAGCKIAAEFNRIYASSFAYDAEGRAVWPAVAINYTNKTQFLFRINKGIDNTWDNEAINRWQPEEERPIPFSRMVFIGDGDTDIPSMKMVRHQGGSAIAVFDPTNWEMAASQDRIQKLISEDRANYVAPADYTVGSQLDVTVKGILGRVGRRIGLSPSR